MQELPDDWEMLSFTYFHPRLEDIGKKNVYRAHYFVSAAGYIVRNSTVAKKMIEKGNTDTQEIADRYWNEMIHKGSLSFYAIYPPLICQDVGRKASETQMR